jgi:hypothetical protein
MIAPLPNCFSIAITTPFEVVVAVMRSDSDLSAEASDSAECAHDHDPDTRRLMERWSGEPATRPID